MRERSGSPCRALATSHRARGGAKREVGRQPAPSAQSVEGIFEHTAQQSGFAGACAAAPVHPRVAPGRRWHKRVGRSALTPRTGSWRFDAERVGVAILLQRAHEAGGALRRADGGAEIHHGLGEIAGPPLRSEGCGKALDLALACGNGRLTANSRESRALCCRPREWRLHLNAMAAMAAAV